MNKEIVLRSKDSKGELLEATYLPEKGMSLASFKKGGTEALDLSTKELFEKRSAGLGVMIGPHFHQRNPKIIPPLKNENLFTHIPAMKEHGSKDFFSHGVGRYAPWKYEATEDTIKATLSGDDEWNGVALKEIEDQNFKMEYTATLSEDGLSISQSVVSDKDSLVGIHYYFSLSDGAGTIVSQVQNHFIENQKLCPIPDSWNYDETHTLRLPLDRDIDFTFHPHPNPLKGNITLETKSHNLQVSYTSDSQENAWQLWHPKGASFVCIEPISAQDPRRPNLTVSKINICLKIENLSP